MPLIDPAAAPPTRRPATSPRGIARLAVLTLTLAPVLVACASSPPAWRVAEDTRTPDVAAFRAARGDVDAVRAMGRLAAPELVPELVATLADETRSTPKARAMAAWALGQYGLVEGYDPTAPLATTLRAALAAQAADPDGELRAAIALALGRLRDDGGAAAMANDHDARVRVAAVLGLFWGSTLAQAPPSEGALAAVLAAMRDPDPSVRRAAAIAGSRRPDGRVERALASLVDDGGDTALFAVRGLGKLKPGPDEDSVARLRTLVFRGARALRIEALMALPAAELPAAAFAPLERDPDVVVRAAYAKKTGRAAADEPSGWVRALAIGARAERSETAFEVAWLADPDARVRAAAAAKLARAGAPWPALFDTASADPSLNVRLAAIEALGAIDGDVALVRLRALLAALPPEPALRGALVEAAAAKKSTVLVPDLVAVVRASRAPAYVELRETAVTALAELEAWAALAGLEDDPAPSVAAKIALALARHEGRPVPAPDRRRAPSLFFGEGAADHIALDTDEGRIVIALDRARAPTTTAAVTALVADGFYDGTVFHRLEPNFVVQGGDPTGTGWGDAGFQLPDEVSEVPFETGTVGIAKAGPDTGSCQLFITLAPTPHLEGRYTIVGHVVAGMDVVHRLELGATIQRATTL